MGGTPIQCVLRCFRRPHAVLKCTPVSFRLSMPRTAGILELSSSHYTTPRHNVGNQKIFVPAMHAELPHLFNQPPAQCCIRSRGRWSLVYGADAANCHIISISKSHAKEREISYGHAMAWCKFGHLGKPNISEHSLLADVRRRQC